MMTHYDVCEIAHRIYFSSFYILKINIWQKNKPNLTFEVDVLKAQQARIFLVVKCKKIKSVVCISTKYRIIDLDDGVL